MNIAVKPTPAFPADEFWRHSCWAFLHAAFNGAGYPTLRQLADEMYQARAFLDGVARHAHTGNP